MSERITAEKFREAMIRRNCGEIVTHYCPLCQYPIKFVQDNGELFYDPGCHCVKKTWHEAKWQDLVDEIYKFELSIQLEIFKKLGIN